MESRADELRAALVRGGERPALAAREVVTAIDRAVYYAGFCDKFQALLASHDAVQGPHFTFSVCEPAGVVAIVAPPRPALVGLVSTVLPVVAGASTCVVVAGEADPLTAVAWCECLAARHREVAAMDLWSGDAALRASVERDGSENVKRVHTHDLEEAERLRGPKGQGLGYLERFLETKTVWHPVGI